MVEVNTDALKSAAQDFIETLRPIAESCRQISAQTQVHYLQWGVIGATLVADNYDSARDYQAKQAADLVKCLDGTEAGLLSVVTHYREKELESARLAQAIEKIIGLESKLKQDRSDLAEAQKKDQGFTD